jgi:N-methylhydantoinase B
MRGMERHVTPDGDRLRAESRWSEIVRGRLVSAVEEAEAVITKTAYSSQITEGQDFSAAIYDGNGDLLGQTRRSLGEFVGTLGWGLRRVLEMIPPETLEPGDTLITNDPWLGGGHVPDVMSIRPIFWGGRIVGYAASIVHVSDVGGKPTGDGRDNFEEGLHIPPMHLYRGGVLNADLMAVIGANARRPSQVQGDVQAMGSANALMERRAQEILEQRGMADFEAVSGELQGRAERAMRERIASLPDGIYRDELDCDGLGEAVRIAVAVRIARDTVEVDFTGTSPESRWGINVPSQLTYAQTMYALRVILGPDIPLLEGSFRPFQVQAPEGSILNPRRPAPTMLRTIVVHNVCGAIWRALSPLVPEHIPPERICAHFGGIWVVRFRGVYREVPSAYRGGGPAHMVGPYTESYFASGGMGALGNRDGRHAVSMPVNCWNVPVEVMESRAPVVFEEKRLLEDSGGVGKYRGGLGQRVRIRVLSDDPIDFIIGNVGRIDPPPFGLAGAGPGQAGFVGIDGEAVSPRTAHEIRTDQVVTEIIPGGGGYGPVSERSREAVERDVRLGYVSRKAALADYGVDISPPL